MNPSVRLLQRADLASPTIASPFRPVSAPCRATTAPAILGYAASAMVDSIWKGQRWSITLKFIFDGLVYGLTTAATFAWLWPQAVAS